MTDTERDRLRAIQDKWLAHPLIKSHIAEHGEDGHIVTVDDPTYHDVRTTLLPAWEYWFMGFLGVDE